MMPFKKPFSLFARVSLQLYERQRSDRLRYAVERRRERAVTVRVAKRLHGLLAVMQT